MDWPLARASTRIGAGTVQQVAASTDGSRVFAVEPDAGRLHQWRAADGALSVSGPPLSVPATGGASGIPQPADRAVSWSSAVCPGS